MSFISQILFTLFALTFLLLPILLLIIPYGAALAIHAIIKRLKQRRQMRQESHTPRQSSSMRRDIKLIRWSIICWYTFGTPIGVLQTSSSYYGYTVSGQITPLDHALEPLDVSFIALRGWSPMPMQDSEMAPPSIGRLALHQDGKHSDVYLGGLFKPINFEARVRKTVADISPQQPETAIAFLLSASDGLMTLGHTGLHEALANVPAVIDANGIAEWTWHKDSELPASSHSPWLTPLTLTALVTWLYGFIRLVTRRPLMPRIHRKAAPV